MSNSPFPDDRWNPYDENRRSKVCPACHGTCFEDEYEMVDCERCEGWGMIYLDGGPGSGI